LNPQATGCNPVQVGSIPTGVSRARVVVGEFLCKMLCKSFTPPGKKLFPGFLRSYNHRPFARTICSTKNWVEQMGF
jgi:hypothetical protein